MSADEHNARLHGLPLDEAALITAWLANAETGRDEHLEHIANRFEELGDTLESRGDYPGALRNFDRTYDIRVELSRRDASSAGRKRALSVSLTRRGRVHRKLGDLRSAAWSFHGACELRSWLAERYPHDPRYSVEFERARKRLAEVEEEEKQVVGGRPTR